MQKCEHEAEIKRICKILDGNGQKGLIREVSELTVKFNDMIEDMKKITTSMSAIAKSYTERDAIDREKAKSKEGRNKAIQRIGTIFGIAFGIVGTLKVILDHIG